MHIQLNSPKKHILRNVCLGIAALLIVIAGSVFSLQLKPTLALSDLTIVEVEQGDIDIMAPVFGQYASKYEKLISAPSSGKITEILVRSGERVLANSVIAKLSNPDLIQEHNQSKAELIRLQADSAAFALRQKNELLTEQARLAELKATIESAQLDLNANRQLADFGIAAHIELERAELKLAQLQQQLTFSQFRLDTFEQMQALEQEQKHINLELQQQQVSLLAQKVANLTITADINGTLEKLEIELGQHLNTGDTIAKIGSSNELIAKVFIPQRLAEQVEIGAKVHIKHEQTLLNGHISQLDSVVSEGSVQAQVHISDQLPAHIRPALNLAAQVFIAHKPNALFITQQPGMRPLATQIVYQLEQNQIAQQQTVTFSERSGEYLLIAAGAKKGQKLITSDLSQWHNFSQLSIN
ncbi:hypothetical protein PULV_a2379 [Pseudoalteromonas ulvae UL12]|uniref:efflux RND transporter periplasmic adaptor subunit n=1 Tax=Pseudoalteromonas ulvae TaxID=107327 RepID=UPI001593DD08|nr:HlyD family efflux transporter periplasmic adaptor subunit [Pseudoalteromonas ulvae]MBE0364641.1 hypothetical protein [Pseudoalteromonas ulvae UL12]